MPQTPEMELLLHERAAEFSRWGRQSAECDLCFVIKQKRKKKKKKNVYDGESLYLYICIYVYDQQRKYFEIYMSVQ